VLHRTSAMILKYVKFREKNWGRYPAAAGG